MGRPLVTSLFRPHLLSRTEVYYLLLNFADQTPWKIVTIYSNTGIGIGEGGGEGSEEKILRYTRFLF